MDSPVMGLFKTDFFRFFAVGFAAGAVLVFGAFDYGDLGSSIADQVLPAASAAPDHP